MALGHYAHVAAEAALWGVIVSLSPLLGKIQSPLSPYDRLCRIQSPRGMGHLAEGEEGSASWGEACAGQREAVACSLRPELSVNGSASPLPGDQSCDCWK